ncbi:MAG: hypothetical protein JSW46_10835 [Gemmatimonadota bacterium]|nr:MAG: hypothetical protein JSW46_10835 [Gemmatimonadota bacterium]
MRRLEVLIVLYTSSFSQQLTRQQLERVHEEVLEFVDFYRSAAGDAVDFRISLLQIDRELARAEVSEVAPGRYYLAREDIEDELVALGMLGYEFDEVIALYAWNNANPEGAALAYGGGAVGPDGGFLGDVGYNSIGVFARDPGSISRIMIHEVLHNIDDMFSMSGKPDGFLNADEMSRNMPTLLAERPGAFLPHYDDDGMLRYAERERANRATYPWAMQLVYYGWMLQRTPREAWLGLDYGSVIDTGERARGARPLYKRIFSSRANGQAYLPVVAGGPAPEAAAAAGRETPLERRTYRHTDFDGSTLFEGTYYAAWLDLPGPGEPVLVSAGTGTTEIVPLGIGELVAPATVVTHARQVVSVVEGDTVVFETAVTVHGSEGVLFVEAREARFGGSGPVAQGATLDVLIGEDTLRLDEVETGHFAFDVSRLAMGRHELSFTATAPELAFVPRAVRVERRTPWRIWAEDLLTTGVGTPLDVTVRIAQDMGAQGAKVTARLGDRDLRELPDGRYSSVVEEGLLPGLDTVRVRAELPAEGGHEVLEHSIPVYVEPRGWIEVPRRIGAKAGEVVTLEARVRDRMGHIVEGAGLAVAVVIGPDLLLMTEEEPGVYRVRFEPPPGDHRLYVIGLEGSFERRVVSLQVQ